MDDPEVFLHAPDDDLITVFRGDGHTTAKPLGIENFE